MSNINNKLSAFLYKLIPISAGTILFSLIFSMFLSPTVTAERYIFEDFISITKNKIEYIGENPGGQFGSTLSKGDFNNDGIEDLLVGAPFSSTNSLEWNGMVSIIFGTSDGDSNMVTFQGENSGDQLGSSLSSGDFNNDGIDDIAIGAYHAGSEDQNPGKVYVVYGRNNWTSQVINFIDNKPSLELSGLNDGDGFGLALSSQDINNDEIDDLLVGAPFASSTLIDNTGVVYAFDGTDQGIKPKFSSYFSGEKIGERFGSVIKNGDINGDGFDDLVIGAYFSSRVYIYENLVDLISETISPTYILIGDNIEDWFGFSMDLADINADGFDDLAIGEFPYKKADNSGSISIFYGGFEFDTKLDKKIQDPVDESFLGASVILKDLDFDKKPEIIAGAPGVGTPISVDTGDVYIVYSETFSDRNIYTIQDQTISSIIHGEDSDDWFGYSLETLDINGDHYEDLVIGSRYANSDTSADNGKVYILLGSHVPFGYKKTISYSQENYLSRGEFISIVIEEFDIKNKKADDIQKCLEYRDFCFFNFLAMSSFDDIILDPEIILYPDIGTVSQYYEDVLIATMLGLMNGYLNEDDSPFYPEKPISRIQALKVILGAAELVPPKYQFELVDILGSFEKLFSQFSYFSDVDPRISHMWWYPRYVNFAVEKNIVEKSEFFRPDESITFEELYGLIDKTKEYLILGNEEANS